MLAYTPSEIVSVFDQAKNANSAIKKFLKNEVAGDARNERFAKAFKNVLLSPNKEGKLAFVENHLPDYEPHFLVVARYAFQETVAEITEAVITKYADEFNSTYKVTNEKVEVTNKDKFNKIVFEVLDLVKAGLKKSNLPGESFLTKVALVSIFDREVLEVVLPLVVNA